MASLQRSLGRRQLFMVGVGTIVGAGIYSVVGVAAGEAGGLLWLSFVVAGACALLAAMSYAELASMYPKAGAEYQYLRAAFPKRRLVSFLAGYLIAVNAAATAATVALAFGGYLRVFVDVPVPVAAFALLAACTLLNLAGIRQSTWVGIGLIVVEVSGLVLMAGAGLATGEVRAVFASGGEAGLAGAFAASALLFFMFIGFEDVANLAEEAREPRRDIPHALLAAVVATTVLYFLVCVAVLAVVPPQALASSASPLTDAGAAVAPWIGQALAVSALFATASTALVTLISISRLLFGMAREHDLPAVLARTLPRRKTPWVAGLALFAGACALLPLGEIKTTAGVSALGILCVFAAIHLGLMRLRRREPRRERLFRVPLAIGAVPVPALLGLVACLAFATQFEPKVYAVFGAALALGLGLYALARR